MNEFFFFAVIFLLVINIALTAMLHFDSIKREDKSFCSCGDAVVPEYKEPWIKKILPKKKLKAYVPSKDPHAQMTGANEHYFGDDRRVD